MRKRIMNIIKYIILNILLLSIIYLLYLKNIRICLIYNLFKIPCPGCGLTTSLMYLLEGNILESFKYNILTIPIMFAYAFFGIWYIIDELKQKSTFKEFIKKHKNKIIIISVILFVISLLKNIFNPLLY